MKCDICNTAIATRYSGGALCKKCGKSFDRNCDGVDMATVINWVATRTRYFTRREKRKP